MAPPRSCSRSPPLSLRQPHRGARAAPANTFPPRRARFDRAGRPAAAAAARSTSSTILRLESQSIFARLDFAREPAILVSILFRSKTCLRPYSVKRTVSRPICEVKPLQATSVLRWGTTWESVVPQAPLFVPTGHDDPRRYGARTSNPWSARALGVRLLLRGVLARLFLLARLACFGGAIARWCAFFANHTRPSLTSSTPRRGAAPESDQNFRMKRLRVKTAAVSV